MFSRGVFSLSTLPGKEGLHREVAASGGPLLVLLGQAGADEPTRSPPQTGSLGARSNGEEDPRHRSLYDSRFDSSRWVFRSFPDLPSEHPLFPSPRIFGGASNWGDTLSDMVTSRGKTLMDLVLLFFERM